MGTAARQPDVVTNSIGISPGRALWNQRETIADLGERLKALSAAVSRPTDLNLYQWAGFAAFALEFRPDLIIELGRGLGNSTCCFIEVANRLGGVKACRVLSLCLSDDWSNHTVPRLMGIVPTDWFTPAQIEVCSILDYDVEPALRNTKRCLVFWDAHGFDIAEWVLGKLMPKIAEKGNLVLMHDMSDNRLEMCSREYGGQGLWVGTDETIWRGSNAINPSLWLGNICSRVPQAISIVDFTSRNRLPLHSAAESLDAEIAGNPTRMGELRTVLGEDFFSLQAHWYWFTLNEAPGLLSFPRYTGTKVSGIDALKKQIIALQEEAQKNRQEKARLVEEMASLLGEKQNLESTWNAVQSSASWHILNVWRKLRNRIAPDRSSLRKLYDLALRPLRNHPTER